MELAYGKASLEVIREGYFSDPVTTEFVVTEDETFTIPDVVLYPVPELRGRIVNEVGRPVAGAYVRMRHTGFGDADPVCESTEDGRFTLTPSRIPYSADLGLETNVSVVVMDAKTGKGGVTQVNLKNATACENISVQLEPRSASWMLDVVKVYQSPNAKAALQKYSESAAKKGFLGATGMQVPTMREGTWLNTDAKSLEDFRGKFVLLDFWFIGCGPCHRDMPSVRMVHRQLAELLGLQGFPHYILLDPQGRILHNNAVSDGVTLRSYKFETIYEAILSAASK